MQNFSPLVSKLREEFEVTDTQMDGQPFFPANNLKQTVMIFLTHPLALFALEINQGI